MKNVLALPLWLLGFVGAGAAQAADQHQQPVPRVASVDLQRYMGPWFIIGAIGLSLEKGAHNAVETYRLDPDGSIDTVFQFVKDCFDGELETKNTRAWVTPGTGDAEWRVRLIWPIKKQYVISHLEPDYSAAIVARDKRDYVWVLARGPLMGDAQFEAYRARIAAMGYDMSKFSRYPQNGKLPTASAADRKCS